MSHQWICSCDALLSSAGSRWPRFPSVNGTMGALRPPTPRPLGLLVRRPVPCGPAQFVVSLRALPMPRRSGASGRGLVTMPVAPPTGSLPHGRCRVSQVSWRAIPWLCLRSSTPDDPWRLAVGGASGAAPTLTTMKASSLRISRLISGALPPAVYASRRALPRAMQHSLPADGLRLCRAGVEPARESLNNPMFAVSRGRGGLDVKLDDIADRPGAALVTGYGANGRYPRRSASFPAVPPAAGRLLPCHPVA